MIAIHGSIQTGSYEDKNGNKRKRVEIIADSVSFCGSKSESGGNTQRSENSGAQTFSNGSADDFNVDEESDELPF